MSADEKLTAYASLLTEEQAAWARFRASKRGDEYDAQLLAEWLAASRRVVAARSKVIDKVLDEDPGLMQRPL